jgi:hypothetical protein
VFAVDDPGHAQVDLGEVVDRDFRGQFFDVACFGRGSGRRLAASAAAGGARRRAGLSNRSSTILASTRCIRWL